MSYTPFGGIVSAGNSTSAPLGGAASFVGVWERITSYGSISIVGQADQAGTLFAEFSIDGITVDRTVQLSDGITSDLGIHSLIPIAQFFRVRVVNGAVPQGTLRVQTIYLSTARVALPTSRLAQPLTNYSDVLNSRSALFGLTDNSISTREVSVGADGGVRASLTDPLGAFGDLLTTRLNPRVQIDAVYGLLTTDVDTFVSGVGASASGANSMFAVDCGTSVGGYGTIRSVRLARYRPGEGIICRLTAMFDPGGPDYLSGAGMFTATDGIWFGYNAAAFGITRRIPGTLEIRQLTITGGATGAGTVVITLNGVAFNVVFTGALTIAATAQHIAQVGVFTGWNVQATSNGLVTFMAQAPATMAGAFTFAAGATGSTATGPAQIRAGSPNDTNTGFVAQTAWNIDRMDGSNGALNPSGILLDPSKLNVYQILYPYLGAGSPTFYVMDGATGKFALVHRDAYPNTFTVPSALDPSYRVGWFSASINVLSTTSRVVKGASGAIFIEGEKATFRNPLAAARTATGVGATEVGILSIRSRTTFNGLTNQRIADPHTITVALEGTKSGVIRVYLNAQLSGSPAWAQVNSMSAVDQELTNGLTITGGTMVAAIGIPGGSNAELELHEIDLRLQPGDRLTITGQVTGGAGSQLTVAVNWEEN